MEPSDPLGSRILELAGLGKLSRTVAFRTIPVMDTFDNAYVPDK